MSTEIIAANGRDMLQFTFTGGCFITVHAYTEDGETIAELTQDNIPDDDQGKHYWHVGCKTGWTFYLTNLKSLCEGGVDLRNKDEQLQHVVNS